tara:strand:- start:20585 stop:21958 length:1374 start_codon:yes stop_codon:yes gene_type:complete
MTASAGAWYRVGTVSVTNNNAAIVGIGSNWLNDVIAIAIGDAFTIDAKTWYEVISVNDDTSITLDRGFEGATASDVEYAILRNTSGTILTRIAGQIAVQFNQKQLFLDELRNWLTSEDETATLTDSHGIAHVVKTVNKIQELTGTAASEDVVTSDKDTTQGRLLNFGYGGLGGDRGVLDTVDTLVRNGWSYQEDYSINGSATGVVGVITAMASNANQGFQIGSFGAQGDGANGSLYNRRQWQGGGWDEWRKIYDSGNSVNPLDYGLGGNAPLLADLDDTTTKTGIYSVTSATANSIVDGFQVNGFVAVMARANGARIVWDLYDEGSLIKHYTRVYNSGLTEEFTDWLFNYHSGNTNFNEFGGFAANDTIGIAGRVTNATAALALPINSKVAPTSLTRTGSFNIIRNGINEGAVTSLTLTSGSSNKVAILEFGGVTFNQGDFIQVRTVDATSKIKVNF